MTVNSTAEEGYDVDLFLAEATRLREENSSLFDTFHKLTASFSAKGSEKGSEKVHPDGDG